MISVSSLTTNPQNATIKMLDELHEDAHMNKRRKEILERHKTPITQAKDGRWRTRVKLPNGKWKAVFKSTRRELEEALMEIYEEQVDIIAKSYREVFEEWYEERKEFDEVRPSSLTRYRTDFNRFFPPEDPFCRIDISKISESDLTKFIKRKIREHGLTNKTYKGLRLLLRGVLKYAKREGYTEFSVGAFFLDLSLPSNIFAQGNVKEAKDEIFTDEELKMLKEYLSDHPTLQNYGLLLLFLSGLRVGELSALKWTDVDSTGRILIIRRTEVQFNGENGHREVSVQDMTKTAAGYRKVFLPEEAIPILDRLRLLSSSDEFIFTRSSGERIRSKSFNDALQRACRKVNIPPRTPHKCRKTYSSALIDAGADSKFVQAQLGHKDFTTTKKYYDFDRSSDSDKLNLIDDMHLYNV